MYFLRVGLLFAVFVRSFLSLRVLFAAAFVIFSAIVFPKQITSIKPGIQERETELGELRNLIFRGMLSNIPGNVTKEFGENR